MTNLPIDPALSEHLKELTALANEIGAAVWIIRGAKEATLVYTPDSPHLQAVLDRLAQELKNAPISIAFRPDVSLEIDGPGVLVVMRFPASDGGEDGVEYSDGQ